MALDGKPVAEHRDPSFDLNDRLFHYTSSSGLFGILESNCLWATHYRFLNDSKELYAARGPLVRLIGKAVARGIVAAKVNREIQVDDGADIKGISFSEAERIVSEFYKYFLVNEADVLQPYVFSTFTCPLGGEEYEDGTLLHWSTYGRSGGYAIEFNPHKLDKLMSQEQSGKSSAYVSNPAIYDVDMGVNDVIRPSVKYLEEFGRKHARFIVSDGKERPDDFGQLVGHFYGLVSVIKDPYFRLEREARVVVYRAQQAVADKTLYDVHVREVRGVPVPYIRLIKGMLLGNDCPIERIIIGPHPDNERRRIALDIFLQAKGLSKKIAVSSSNVPFVGGPF